MPLSPLSPADIPEVMRIERLPGYDAFVGRWDLDEHTAELASSDARYFGLRDGDRLGGFVILQKVREREAVESGAADAGDGGSEDRDRLFREAAEVVKAGRSMVFVRGIISCEGEPVMSFSSVLKKMGPIR